MNDGPPIPVPSDGGQVPGEQPGAPAQPYEITEDTECLACGYNLRGLRTDGRCPECGTAIGRSIHGNFLKFANPQWVRRLATGMKLILWGLLINIIVGILGAVLANALGMPLAVLGLISLLAGLVGLAGTWMLTSPDPSQLDEGWELNARQLIRITMLIGLGGQLVNIASHLILQGVGASKGMVVSLTVVSIALGLVHLVGVFAQFVYFGKLAMRIPDRKLSQSTRTVMWGYVVGRGLVLLLTLIDALLLQGGGGGAPAAVMIPIVLGCGGGLLLIIFCIWWLLLLFRYRKCFAVAAETAEQTWYGRQGGAMTPPSTNPYQG